MSPPIGPAYRIPGSASCMSSHLLLRLTGSAFVRVLPYGISAAIYSVVIHHYRSCWLWPSLCPAEKLLFIHPYPLQGILILSGLGLVFRVNQSLMRYWEARSAAQFAAAKWLDGILMAISFDDEEDVGEGKLQGSHVEFACACVHLGSLLHAMAMHALRGDDSMDTLECAVPRPPDGRTYYVTGRQSTQVEAKKISRRRSLMKKMSWRHRMEKPDMTLRRAARIARASPSLARRSLVQSRAKDVKDYADRNPIEVLGGLTAEERRRLEPSEQRVCMVLGWLFRLLVRRRRRGGLSHDAPIVSRIYQVLSDGNLHFMNALKVSDTPFPFAYAQLNGVICLLNFAFFPLVVADKTADAYLGAALSFSFTCLFFAMHDVARDLEEPFTSELGVWLGANRLCVSFMQAEFDDRLLACNGAAARPLLLMQLPDEAVDPDEEEQRLYGDMLTDALGKHVETPMRSPKRPSERLSTRSNDSSRRSERKDEEPSGAAPQQEANGGGGASGGGGVDTTSAVSEHRIKVVTFND